MKAETRLLLATADYARAFRRGDVDRIDDALSRVELARAEISREQCVARLIRVDAPVIRLADHKHTRRAVYVRAGKLMMRVA